jgi:hypothetical protein
MSKVSIITEIHSQISSISRQIDFSPVQIPAELAELPVEDGIKGRLLRLVKGAGGFESLAAALPQHSARIWQNKVEANGYNKLTLEDFDALIEFFNDSVLLALLAGDHGFNTFDLRSIPPSEHSIVDLMWALRRHQAHSQLLACDLRERLMEGLPTDALKADIAQNLMETVVLTTQIAMALKGFEQD